MVDTVKSKTGPQVSYRSRNLELEGLSKNFSSKKKDRSSNNEADESSEQNDPLSDPTNKSGAQPSS